MEKIQQKIRISNAEQNKLIHVTPHETSRGLSHAFITHGKNIQFVQGPLYAFNVTSVVRVVNYVMKTKRKRKLDFILKVT
jgi:hypothetical protein